MRLTRRHVSPRLAQFTDKISPVPMEGFRCAETTKSKAELNARDPQSSADWRGPRSGRNPGFGARFGDLRDERGSTRSRRMSTGTIFRRRRRQCRLVDRSDHGGLCDAEAGLDIERCATLPSRGGSGGTYQPALCGANELVTAVEIQRTADYKIFAVKPTCRSVKTWAAREVYLHGNGGYRGRRRR